MDVFFGLFSMFLPVILIGVMLFVASRYKRCPSDKVLVVYGRTSASGAFKCVHGGGVIVWPLIQDYGVLSLAPMKASVEVNNAFAPEKNRVSLKATVTFAISTEKRYLQRAAERLLSFPLEQIETITGDIAEGQLCLTIAKHTPAEIIENEFAFIEEVKEAINEEIGKLGLQAINVRLKDIVAKEIE